MVLQAKKTAVPFLGLMGMFIASVSAVLWDFLRRGDFTLGALSGLAQICMVLSVPTLMVYMGLGSVQSVQLDEEGVSAEMLSFRGGAAILPKFRRALLRWEDVKEISTRGNDISLRGERLVVRVNTFYFDAVDVFQLIDQCWPPKSR
ncbi:hypothetical protein OTB17_09260 [Massilia sp. H27-R4]|nr:hypothetical protein [Massilia sp. H27-R4]